MSDVSVLIRQLQAVLSRLIGKSIAFGNDVVTWPGATNASSQTTVSHGLGTVPSQVYVSARGGSHFCVLESNDTTWTANDFKVDAYSVDGVPGAGQQTRFSWLAVG